MDSKIFISYSQQDERYCTELLSALRTVPSIRERVWVDRRGIDIGDEFDAEIRKALDDSAVAILLVSNRLLTSEYVRRHELPFLLRQAQRGALKLGVLYVSRVAEAALTVEVEIDGSVQSVDLAAFHGVNPPQEPLDCKTAGDCNRLYAEAADWAARQLRPAPLRPPPLRPASGSRHELAIRIEDRGDHWQHQFFPGRGVGAIQKPDLDCLPPAMVFGTDLDGETLFELLFGSDPAKFGPLFAAAFEIEGKGSANPTYAPLRVRLLTAARQLHLLPWGTIAYRGRALRDAGWSVEFHSPGAAGFPEYPEHLCHFPGRVLLAGSTASQRSAHFDDLRCFFQRHWPNNPEPAIAAAADSLRAALRVGSTRLVYYHGPASQAGLLLHDRSDGECLSWHEFADCLRQSRSVSLLFLNLLGDAGYEALEHGPLLVDAVNGAVLFQCNPRTSAHAAARAGLACLEAVFCRRSDPVLALQQHSCGQSSAWTRYASWQALAPARLQHPDLVNLLLDRRRQRDTLAGARDEFYDYPARRIHHVVALGTPGCRASEFPPMIRQHLVNKPRERESYRYWSLELTPGIRDLQGVDDRVRRRLHLNPRQPLLDALVDREALAGNAYCFLVLGWQAGRAAGDAAATLRAVADWCRQRLGPELAASSAQVRVISIVAIEAEQTDELKATVEQLIEEYDVAEGFHFAELDPLAAVLPQDLRNYFRNKTICGCDDRYRERFPALLLGSRKEMPFDEAVRTIHRGEPDNWGNLFAELQELRRTGA